MPKKPRKAEKPIITTWFDPQKDLEGYTERRGAWIAKVMQDGRYRLACELTEEGAVMRLLKLLAEEKLPSMRDQFVIERQKSYNGIQTPSDEVRPWKRMREPDKIA